MLKTYFAPLYITSFLSFSYPYNSTFTAAYDNNKKMVLIKWQQSTGGVKSFIVQRSIDKFTWADIARLENTATSFGKTYNDDKSEAGENYYRLKWITVNNEIGYSATKMVKIGNGMRQWVMYPVPVTTMLTLKYKGTEKITGVINVEIINWAGKILTRRRHASNTTVIQIPVDNLGRGAYNVTITIENEIVWNQRFVK